MADVMGRFESCCMLLLSSFLFQRGALGRAVEHSTSDHCVPGFQDWGTVILHLIARRPVRRSYDSGC